MRWGEDFTDLKNYGTRIYADLADLRGFFLVLIKTNGTPITWIFNLADLKKHAR
ncbi:MAG: hypothetical protein FWG87_04785 [Defluviitaleaceae bacterium]|nr:hypothetical protein [Defluviitaleaceae bacterium]